ncbi:hypothetical protein [Aquihabitans sp. McL0605]|uniref:hypothetical protein n=1 Tax=Aquihabitans sp. McL0605 TaxID=3415671 RepID=UPI003CF62B1C
MRAGDVERILRRIGWVFILGLVLQPRISGRAVLLPVAAAAMVWALAGLRPIATSPDGRRGLQVTMGVAALVTVLGVIGWVPSVEAAGLSLVVLLGFVAGLLAYIAFTSGWCDRAGWTEARDHLRKARPNLYAICVLTVAALGAALVLGRAPAAGASDPDWWSLVAGRVVGTGWVVGYLLLVFVFWVGACVDLERGAKALRAVLADDPEAPAPAA